MPNLLTTESYDILFAILCLFSSILDFFMSPYFTLMVHIPSVCMAVALKNSKFVLLNRIHLLTIWTFILLLIPSYQLPLLIYGSLVVIVLAMRHLLDLSFEFIDKALNQVLEIFNIPGDFGVETRILVIFFSGSIAITYEIWQEILFFVLFCAMSFLIFINNSEPEYIELGLDARVFVLVNWTAVTLLPLWAQVLVILTNVYLIWTRYIKSPGKRKFIMKELRCSHCHQDYNNDKNYPEFLPCIHEFCSSCIQTFNSKCPTCQAQFDNTQVIKNFSVCDLLEEIALENQGKSRLIRACSIKEEPAKEKSN